jgi:hypothetical protein
VWAQFLLTRFSLMFKTGWVLQNLDFVLLTSQNMLYL